MKGIDLKLQRIGARIKASELARAMNVTTSRISHIESRDEATDESARKYLAALETLTTVPSSETPREAA
jgi:DNA-binding transcriptional regulator YiaG